MRYQGCPINYSMNPPINNTPENNNFFQPDYYDKIPQSSYNSTINNTQEQVNNQGQVIENLTNTNTNTNTDTSTLEDLIKQQIFLLKLVLLFLGFLVIAKFLDK